MAKARKPKSPKSVETLTHEESKPKNIPTAEYSAMHGGAGEEVKLRYPRNTDLDPQLVWRGEDAKEKATTLMHYWVPSVNHHGGHGRWAAAEFTDAYAIEADFAATIDEAVATVIAEAIAVGSQVEGVTAE